MRIEHGLKQKPNWSGTVYGMCITPRCGNHRMVGYYEGGFCKVCSIRHPADAKLPVLTRISTRGTKVDIPNPAIRWSVKRWVQDLSERLSAEAQRRFYMTPEQQARMEDRIDYDAQDDEEEEELPIVEAPE